MVKSKYLMLFKLLFVFLLAFNFSACKKTDINPHNFISYKIKNKKYEYPFHYSPGTPGFFGSYHSISAKIFVPSAVRIEGNNGRYTYNKLDIGIIAKNDKQLPNRIDLSDTLNYDFDIIMEMYKQVNGYDFELIEGPDAGFFEFSHLGEDYVEGTFDMKMKEINGNQIIHLKDGKFKIQVIYVGSSIGPPGGDE